MALVSGNDTFNRIKSALLQDSTLDQQDKTQIARVLIRSKKREFNAAMADLMQFIPPRPPRMDRLEMVWGSLSVSEQQCVINGQTLEAIEKFMDRTRISRDAAVKQVDMAYTYWSRQDKRLK